ncbi:hypothetical protein ACWCQN_37940 [Streptomyces sp. NPDC001984]
MPEGLNEWGTFTLDASSATPPVLPYRTYFADTGVFLADNTWLDSAAILHFSTNPDPGQWPIGAVWPPYPADPVGDYVYLLPYASGELALPASAWAAIRPLPGVYGFMLSGPRTSYQVPGIKYAILRQIWKFGRASGWPILHHSPVANAGPARVWSVSRGGGNRLQEELRLDGGRSMDPDGDSLTYTWSLQSFPPGAPQLPWRPLVGTTPVALPAGTEIPDAALGTYTFRLTVTDSYGSATATVSHSILHVNTGPRADAGPPERSFRLLAGLRPKEDIVVDASASSDPDGDPLTFTWRETPPWPSGLPLLRAPVTQTDPVLLLAPAGQKLSDKTVPLHYLEVEVKDTAGAAATDQIRIFLGMVRPTVTLGAGAPQAIALDELTANGLRLPVTVTKPDDPDLVEPDSWELEIFDRTNSSAVSLFRRPVGEDEIADAVVWDGTAGPGTVARPGRFGLRLRGYTEGGLCLATDLYDITVVDVEVTVEGQTQPTILIGESSSGGFGGSTGPYGPGSGGSFGGGGSGPGTGPGPAGPFGGPIGGGTDPVVGPKALPIQPVGPAMPTFTVAVTVHGPTDYEIAALAIETRVRLEWIRDGQPQAQQVPSEDWHTLPAGQSRWTVTPNVFAGGELTAQTRVTYKGITVTRESTGAPPVLGRNPGRDEVFRAVGGPGFAEAAYEPSGFRQFGSDAPSLGDVVLSYPYSKNGRVGLTGLTKPNTEQEWNWRANVNEFRRRAQLAQTAALDDEAAVRAAHGGNVVPLSADELNLEIWTRLDDPAVPYHAYDPASQKWFRIRDFDGATAARERADRLSFLSATVQAGQPPRDWTTASAGGTSTAKLSQSPEGAIRSLLSDGGPLDSAVAASYSVLSPLRWWELHTTLDALAGPGTGPATAGLVDLLAVGAAGTARDPRVVAAVEVTRLRRGSRTLTEADLPGLRRFSEALLQLSPIDQQLALQSLGLSSLTAEGIVAVAGSGDGFPDVSTSVAAARPAPILRPAGPASARPSMPFGSWKLPGEMPEAYYIGLSVHLMIGANYKAMHGRHGFVATNTETIMSIVNTLAQSYPDFTIDKILNATAAILKPDILEVSLQHFPPAHAYEIKPQGSEGLALVQLARYMAALVYVGVPVAAGPMGLPGTYGLVPAPDGWARFSTPEEGVITYRYFKAPIEEVRARNEKERRKERLTAKWQRDLENAGWSRMSALLAVLIVEALLMEEGIVPIWAIP